MDKNVDEVQCSSLATAAAGASLGQQTGKLWFWNYCPGWSTCWTIVNTIMLHFQDHVTTQLQSVSEETAIHPGSANSRACNIKACRWSFLRNSVGVDLIGCAYFNTQKQTKAPHFWWFCCYLIFNHIFQTFYFWVVNSCHIGCCLTLCKSHKTHVAYVGCRHNINF